MQSFLSRIAALVLSVLEKFLPKEIYERLTSLYDISLLLLAAGIVFLIAALLMIIIRVIRLNKERSA